MVFLWEGNMSVVRVRSVVLIREGIEGRKEGGRDSPHICAFQPVHSAAFDTPSFIVARPFFNSIHFLSFSLFLLLFQRRNRDGSGGSSFSAHRDGTETCAQQRQAGVTRFIHQSCIHRIEAGRENWEGGSVHIIFIHHHRQSKQSKAKKDGKLEGEEEEKEEEKKPRT